MTEPTAWALYNSRNPEFNEVEFAYPYCEPITKGDKKAGWTAVPLYTLEAAAAEERAKIVEWLREQDGHGYDDMRANCIEAGEHRK